MQLEAFVLLPGLSMVTEMTTKSVVQIDKSLVIFNLDFRLLYRSYCMDMITGLNLKLNCESIYTKISAQIQGK